MPYEWGFRMSFLNIFGECLHHHQLCSVRLQNIEYQCDTTDMIAASHVVHQLLLQTERNVFQSLQFLMYCYCRQCFSAVQFRFNDLVFVRNRYESCCRHRYTRGIKIQCPRIPDDLECPLFDPTLTNNNLLDFLWEGLVFKGVQTFLPYTRSSMD